MTAPSTAVETSLRTRVVMVGGSVLLTLLLAEWVLFPILLPFTPLRLHVHLDAGVRALAQSSKRGVLPEPGWLALVGDSYAQGRGDWLLSEDPDRNRPFHSAHVIQRATGRDVLSFGRGGTGAVRSVQEAVAKQRYLAESLRFPLAPPAMLLVYFYEGNDLHDTLLELYAFYGKEVPGGEEGADFAGLLKSVSEAGPDHFRRVLTHPGFRDPEDLDERIRAGIRARPLSQRLSRPRLLDEWYGLRFVRAALGEWAGHEPASPDEDVFPLRRQRPNLTDAVNMLRVGGREVKLGVELQGPALDLENEEIDAALWTFGESLRFLGTAFAESEVCVVYIPSPAACYAWSGAAAHLQTFGGRPAVHAPEAIGARSGELRRRVAGIAAARGARFVDPTPELVRRARRVLIHGPTDMRHFNREGYTILGRAAATCAPGER